MRIRVFVVLIMMLLVAQNSVALSTDDRPDYQKEYDAYLHDLQVIEQKGYAPKNEILADDLAKMSSEERIRLTPNLSELRQKKSIDDSSAQAEKWDEMENLLKVAQSESAMHHTKGDAEIVNRVEIIRVPEEFRKQYADVYAEETKHISSEKLVDQQEEQDMADAQEALKVAEHDNPFQSLEEKQLDAVVEKKQKKDSLTDAYFQHSRAYVADEPIVIKKKDSQNGVSQADSSQESVAAPMSASQSSQNSNSTKTYTYSPSSSSSSSGFAGGGSGLGKAMFLE